MKRAEVNKMARKLQNRLALAQFKTKHGWEDLTLDTIEPKVEAELLRRRPGSSGDVVSDSSSNSDLQYPRALMSSSPLKGPIFSDAVESSGSSGGPRKRHYTATEYQRAGSSNGSRKRFRLSPSHSAGKPGWKGQHNLPQSSPIKPRKYQNSLAHPPPNLSFPEPEDTQYEPSSPPNFAAVSDDEDDMLPIHSFQFPASHHQRSHSPPRTPPPMRSRPTMGGRRANSDRTPTRSHRSTKSIGSAKEEGADLLLYLATSPSPANPLARSLMHPPSTPPSRTLALPSSMMTTPGGGSGLFPNTPSQNFEFSDFVNITPSPAQGGGRGLWSERTTSAIKTPSTVGRRRLDFGMMISPAGKREGLGMQLGPAL